jgi:REP element-mobilizing transposase RayT
MKTHYKNRLPHIAPIGASFFITFRLADSLPQTIITALQEEMAETEKRLRREFPNDWYPKLTVERKRMFGKYEHQLDGNPFGNCHLKDPAVASIVADKLREYDGKLYDLAAFCIMPNHVHLLLDFSCQLVNGNNFFLPDMPADYKQLHQVMQLIKGGSARSINLLLKRTGSFWAKDSYDHFVRNEQEWGRILHYIFQNPVKAGLVTTWEDFPFTYRRL